VHHLLDDPLCGPVDLPSLDGAAVPGAPGAGSDFALRHAPRGAFAVGRAEVRHATFRTLHATVLGACAVPGADSANMWVMGGGIGVD
jgi:hypothetical protein